MTPQPCRHYSRPHRKVARAIVVPVSLLVGCAAASPSSGQVRAGASVGSTVPESGRATSSMPTNLPRRMRGRRIDGLRTPCRCAEPWARRPSGRGRGQPEPGTAQDAFLRHPCPIAAPRLAHPLCRSRAAAPDAKPRQAIGPCYRTEPQDAAAVVGSSRRRGTFAPSPCWLAVASVA